MDTLCTAFALLNIALLIIIERRNRVILSLRTALQKHIDLNRSLERQLRTTRRLEK
jgi:hypothetical protein